MALPHPALSCFVQSRRLHNGASQLYLVQCASPDAESRRCACRTVWTLTSKQIQRLLSHGRDPARVDFSSMVVGSKRH